MDERHKEGSAAEGWLLAGSLLLLAGTGCWYLTKFHIWVFPWSFIFLMFGIVYVVVGLGIKAHIWK